MTVTSINCKNTSETPHNDEVFIIYQADAGIPVRFPATSYQRMNTSADSANDVVSTWTTNLKLEFDHEVLVTLWDEDSKADLNKPTFLANVEYRADYFTSSWDMPNHNDAHYVINATKNN
ncbi:MAG: hypothetical protein C0500_06515 [Sphingobium sp.]|nr:hypothetical protein [Sphingobium sp.]